MDGRHSRATIRWQFWQVQANHGFPIPSSVTERDEVRECARAESLEGQQSIPPDRKRLVRDALMAEARFQGLIRKFDGEHDDELHDSKHPVALAATVFGREDETVAAARDLLRRIAQIRAEQVDRDDADPYELRRARIEHGQLLEEALTRCIAKANAEDYRAELTREPQDNGDFDKSLETLKAIYGLSAAQRELLERRAERLRNDDEPWSDPDRAALKRLRESINRKISETRRVT